MDRRAGILHGRVAENGYLAGVRIDLHIDDMRGKGATDAWGIDAGPANDGTAGGV